VSLKELGSGFESVLRVMKNNLGHDVHHLWALSKDFGSSGFRIGTLYTQNTHLLSSLANLNIFSSVSHPMQMILSEVLMDDNFIYSFLDRAREKIRYSYYFVTRKLDEMVIPYVKAKSGIFVYVDFSALLPSQTPEGEEKFASLLLDAARIIMTPGQSQKDLKPGMFRICYCFVSLDVLEIAMNRLDKIVGKMRRWDWENLKADSLTDIL
jgi:1-aminocyclopropane-1-carboxylate synthase